MTSWSQCYCYTAVHVTCRLQGYARVYDQSENKEIGGRGAKLGGGGAKLLVGGHGPPVPQLATACIEKRMLKMFLKF